MKKYLLVAIVLVSIMVFVTGCGQDEHGHEHGDLPYEWSGEYTLSTGTYIFEFGESEDEACAIAFLLLDGDMEDIAHHAQHIMEAPMDEIIPQGSFQAKPEHGYILTLNLEGTTFTFEIIEAGEYVIFTEHLPEEFDLKIIRGDGTILAAKNPVEYDHDNEY